jgi:glutathione S-transferase
MTTLYGRANAWNVRKVMFFIEEIGLAANRLDYGRGFEPTNTPEFLAMNPNGLVPVLKDGVAVIWESHTILRYLASKYADEGYYPKALERRAVVDQWLDWKLGSVMLPLRGLFFHHYLKVEQPQAELDAAEAECARLFTILDAQVGKTGAFAEGAHLTIADCALGMAVHRWLGLPLRRPDLPHIQRYYAELGTRPAFQKTVLTGMP